MNPYLIKLIVDILRKWGIAMAIFITAVSYAYYSGKKTVYDKWAIEQAKTDRLINTLKVKQSQLSQAIETRYIDKVQVIKLRGQERTRYVYKYITPEIDNNCVITNPVVSLLNSAIEDTIPLTPNPPDATASDIDPIDISRTTRHHSTE